MYYNFKLKINQFLYFFNKFFNKFFNDFSIYKKKILYYYKNNEFKYKYISK